MKILEIKTIPIGIFFKRLKVYYPELTINKSFKERGGLLWAQDPKVFFPTINALVPKIILEIGTHKGETTLGIANSSPKSRVYTMDICKEMRKDIDPFQRPEILPKSKVGQVFKDKKRNIVQIFGDSRDIKTYPFNGKKIDLAFIDGNHNFDAVVKDSLNTLKFMKHQSIVFWHDFIINGNSQVPAALGYLKAKKGLDIYHIKDTWLAFYLLDKQGLR
jgi:predicted O-methyltransferase YrrM